MALIGNLLGMWITRKHNINTKQTIGIIIFSLFMTLIMIIVLFFVGGVENDNIIGIPPNNFRLLHLAMYAAAIMQANSNK